MTDDVVEPKQRFRLRDLHPWNDSFNSMEVATADKRFEQLIERRERLIERSRFGMLALNGASLAAILSNYTTVESGLGADPRASIICFATGLVAALFSVFFETIFVGHRAAHMFGHLSYLRRIRSTLDSYATEQNETNLEAQLAELSERVERTSTKIHLNEEKDGLPTDFAFSRLALLTLNASGGAWIGGLVAVLYRLLA